MKGTLSQSFVLENPVSLSIFFLAFDFSFSLYIKSRWIVKVAGPDVRNYTYSCPIRNFNTQQPIERHENAVCLISQQYMDLVPVFFISWIKQMFYVHFVIGSWRCFEGTRAVEAKQFY